MIKEVTWTYLLGWQWVALGALIIVNVVFFQQGILGWAMEKWPGKILWYHASRSDLDPPPSPEADSQP